MTDESMSGEPPLKGFFAYKDRFEPDAIWVNIPRSVRFVYVSNPYLDSETPPPEAHSASFTCTPPRYDFPLDASRGSSTSVPSISRSSSGTSAESFSTQIRTPSIAAGEETLLSSLPLRSPAEETLCWLFGQSYADPSETVAEWLVPHSLSPIDAGFEAPQLQFQKPAFGSEDTRDSQDWQGSRSQDYQANLDMEPLSSGDHEIAFLLRWYSERAGGWMDIFDTGAYFTSYVPVKSQRSTLLKHAAIAYAAKILARVGEHGPITGVKAPNSMQHRMRFTNWQRRAAEYHNTALSLLLQALKEAAAKAAAESEKPCTQCLDKTRCSSRTHHSGELSSANSDRPQFEADEILTASAILCMYEFLDGCIPEWLKHLSGAKCLFNLPYEYSTPSRQSGPGPHGPLERSSLASHARRATFWNIVRQDMLAAYITKSKTRVDTEDLRVWKEVGLHVDEQGLGIYNKASMSDGSELAGMVNEVLASNLLIWLMAKLVNFVAHVDGRSKDPDLRWVGGAHHTPLQYWTLLHQQFQAWYDHLPAVFRVSTRVEPLQASRQLSENGNMELFPETWYSSSMCASAMQLYHMGQILLHTSKPHGTCAGEFSVDMRLRSYRDMFSACRTHSREIVSISLAHVDEAVRVQSVQPLFAAGQCFTEPNERKVVLGLVRDIQRDTGWRTDYVARQLTELWHWDT